jgi:hypothetical protein
MKKLFAYAAMALAALLLTTHSDAKPGGFAKPHMAWHAHGMHPHHFADFRRFDHRHRFARGFDFGFGFPYFDYGYGAPYYAEPLIVAVPQPGDVTGATEPRRASVGEGPRGCSTENVTVPASAGGETTVRVIRC